MKNLTKKIIGFTMNNWKRRIFLFIAILFTGFSIHLLYYSFLFGLKNIQISFFIDCFRNTIYLTFAYLLLTGIFWILCRNFNHLYPVIEILSILFITYFMAPNYFNPAIPINTSNHNILEDLKPYFLKTANEKDIADFVKIWTKNNNIAFESIPFAHSTCFLYDKSEDFYFFTIIQNSYTFNTSYFEKPWKVDRKGIDKMFPDFGKSNLLK